MGDVSTARVCLCVVCAAHHEHMRVVGGHVRHAGHVRLHVGCVHASGVLVQACGCPCDGHARKCTGERAQGITCGSQLPSLPLWQPLTRSTQPSFPSFPQPFAHATYGAVTELPSTAPFL